MGSGARTLGSPARAPSCDDGRSPLSCLAVGSADASMSGAIVPMGGATDASVPARPLGVGSAAPGAAGEPPAGDADGSPPDGAGGAVSILAPPDAAPPGAAARAGAHAA